MNTLRLPSSKELSIPEWVKQYPTLLLVWETRNLLIGMKANQFRFPELEVQSLIDRADVLIKEASRNEQC